MFQSARAGLIGVSGVIGVIGAALVACSGSSNRDGFSDANPTDPAAGNGAGPGTAPGFGGADAGAAKGSDGCSDEAKLVYVLSLEGDIYSFAPADKKFTKIGPLDCKSGDKKFMPISMGVDRSAVAWVNMREVDPIIGIPIGDDVMFKVDTKTAACTATKITGGWGGMGFSTDEGTKDKETLYVNGGGLQKVNFAQEKFETVAQFNESVDMELTGTGDGKLFAFLISSPLALAQVDKKTGAFTDKVTLDKVQTPRAPMFAFSHWGGDFYFYTATSTSPSRTTTVARYRPSDKSLDEGYMTSIGFHIVGAGVSTCAPTTSPR